ncbi:hypothetical protein [Aquimarina sp. 2304DJ70-9]|uniref:hypothetical protein n=1 Tax=Aquimarina penaris TaxID=3231044 RepID=UPI003461B28F
MKTFKPTSLYIIKILGLIIGTSISIFGITFFIGISIMASLLILLIVLIFIYTILKSNKPAIQLSNTNININEVNIEYDQIESFHSSKGASEPYIISKSGEKIDLELSWFKKKDQAEIESMILEKIKSLNKEV